MQTERKFEIGEEALLTNSRGREVRLVTIEGYGKIGRYKVVGESRNQISVHESRLYKIGAMIPASHMECNKG